MAVSSDGKAPFLSGHIRLILENIFPANWEKVAKMATEFRRKVQARWKGDPDKKAASYGKFLNADWKTILKEKKGDDLEIMLDEMLDG